MKIRKATEHKHPPHPPTAQQGTQIKNTKILAKINEQDIYSIRICLNRIKALQSDQKHI